MWSQHLQLLLLNYFPKQVTGAAEVVTGFLFFSFFFFFFFQCMLMSGHHSVAVEGKVHADAATSLADYPGLKSQTFTESSITGEPPGICRDQDLHIFVLPSPHKPSLINHAVYVDVHRRCGQAVAALMAATGGKNAAVSQDQQLQTGERCSSKEHVWMERERQKEQQNRWNGGFLQADVQDAVTCWAQENGEATHFT